MRTKANQKLPDFSVDHSILNGIKHLIVKSRDYRGVLKVAVVDALGNITTEKNTVMFPGLNVKLKLPERRGTFFVLIDSKKGEVVKRIQMGDSFTQNAV